MPTQVLVVDDSKISRRVLIGALPSEWPVQIHEAANGLEALEICKSRQIDVMFLDLTMPVMDGYDVLETLREIHSDIAVIVVTADVQPKAYVQVMSLGARDFIPKPVAGDNLRGVLQKADIL